MNEVPDPNKNAETKSLLARPRWWRTFVIMLFLIVGILYALGPIYKTWQLQDESHQTVQMSPSVISATYPISLSLAYPRVLQADGYRSTPQPLTVWMQYAGHLSTSSLTDTYIVAFSLYSAGVLFVDKDGIPVAPQVEVTPGRQSPASSVIYLLQLPDYPAASHANLSYTVYDPSGVSVSAADLNPPIGLESAGETLVRQVVSVLADPATPLIPLAVALAVFATREWRILQSRRQTIQAIEHLPDIASESPLSAARQYVEMRRLAQNDLDVRKRLDVTWKRIQSTDWLIPVLDETMNAVVSNDRTKAREMIDLADPPGSGPSLAHDVRLTMELAYAHRDSRLSDFCRVHSSSGVGSALGNILSRYDDDATRSLIAEALSSLASSSTSAYSRTVIMELVLTASGRKMVQEKLPVLIHPYLKLTKELFVAVHSESLTTLAHTRSAQDMAAALDIILLLYDDARAREAITHALVALSTVDMDYAHAIIDQLAVSDKAIFEGIVLAKPPDQSHEAVSRAKEDFWTKIVDNLIDRLNAAIAGSGRLPRGRWLQLWRTGSIATSDSLARYLHRVGLDFNPFGPESAELDPRLPEYAALDQVDLVRGRKRVIMLGGPGSGLTATALLLAHQCDDPPESPVEIGAFPVYYPVFQLSDDRSRMSVCFLRSMSHVIARMLLRFVAVRPYGWLELPGEQRDRLSAFLLTSFGSKDSLLGELRRVARDPEYGRLANSVENARIGFIHTDDLDELDWLDLIAGSIPSGFDSIYILLDARDSTASNEAAGNWKTWLDLSVLLAANNVYLKIFAPTAARSLIGNEVGLESVTLTWDADKLGQTLRDRFGRAGGDSLAALCGPDAPRDADELFVQAALKSKAPPRQLIRLGNRLLVEHSAAAPDRPISGDEIDRILGSQPEQSAKTAGHTEPLRAGM